MRLHCSVLHCFIMNVLTAAVLFSVSRRRCAVPVSLVIPHLFLRCSLLEGKTKEELRKKGRFLIRVTPASRLVMISRPTTEKKRYHSSLWARSTFALPSLTEAGLERLRCVAKVTDGQRKPRTLKRCR